MIHMEFSIAERILGSEVEMAWCHVYPRSDPPIAWIEILLMDGIPLEVIMKNIEHEVIHWTIFDLEGAETMSISEGVVRDMMNGYHDGVLSLDGEY
jgi:hypothetical protein